MLGVRSDGSSRSDDQVFVRKDGSVFPVEVSSQAVMRDGVLDGVVVAFQDISERKKNELFIRLDAGATQSFAGWFQSGIVGLGYCAKTAYI